MLIRLENLEFSLYIGDLPWEKKNLQKVAVTLEIRVKGQPPDYWAVSKAIVQEFSKTKYLWLEDLAVAMADFLKKNFKIKGDLKLSKFPKPRQSPKVFQVELAL